jgi:hypothetical protein
MMLGVMERPGVGTIGHDMVLKPSSIVVECALDWMVGQGLKVPRLVSRNAFRSHVELGHASSRLDVGVEIYIRP